MSFQEKSAWVMCFALLISGSFYAWSVLALANVLQDVPPPNVGGLAIGVIIIVAIAIFGHAVAAIGNPMDANAPEDERDRLVVWRAGNLSGALLGVICMLGLFAFAIEGSGNLLFHIIVAGMVVSQIAEYALTIWYYQRGV
ncbi:MAG: hypothetical protein AAF996_11030 [Pseudomonadota bacterium]